MHLCGSATAIWRECPSSDRVKVASGRVNVIPINEAGLPIGAAAEMEPRSLAEQLTDNEKYLTVYLPPLWRIRIALVLYSLWTVGFLHCAGAVGLPSKLMLF